MSLPPLLRDGRIIVLGFIVGYFLFLGLNTLVLNNSLSIVFKELGVPAMDPHFGDLRNIVAGIENQDAGHAEGEPNSYDPWGRPYIYPSLWLNLKAIGFNRETVDIFGVLIVLTFLGSIFLLLGKLNWAEGFFTGFFVISPAIMTGIERCNISLVLFPLILAALALRHRPVASSALLFLVTILKIHPVGAFLALVGPPWKKTLPFLAGILALLFFWALFHAEELIAISSHAPHYPVYTFGSAVWGLWFIRPDPSTGAPDLLTPLIWGTLALVALGGLAVRFSPRLAPEPQWEWEMYAFRLGAGLHLAQFALGSNNDYGLLFFLFCLPLLFRFWLSPGPIRWWATTALLCSLIYVNWDLFSEEYMLRHMLLKQALAWTLVATLLGLLNATRTWPVPWDLNPKQPRATI